MADDQPVPATAPPAPPPAAVAVAAASPALSIQLTQVRVPLEDTAEALATADASGRLPIVVLPEHALRIRNELVIAGVIALVVGFVLDFELALRGAVLGLGGVLIVLGVFRSFMVPVPEGSQAVLLRRGRFYKTLGPGNHVVPPWIIVSHVVTTRETPFDAPATSIPTKDDVRTNVDILMTFSIAEPEKFVFTIAAPDFDQVCQATCQEHVRLLIRDKSSEEVLDMGVAENDRLREGIGAALTTYGVEVVRVVLTHVMPPMEFVASRESRRLAAVQRAEEEERHALAVRRQSDSEELDRQRISARREAIELEAANEVARLERLEARIRAYPNAMHWDVESQRLEVARALAGNTRAMVQVGPAADVAASLLMHTLPEDGMPPPVSAEPEPEPGDRRGGSGRTRR
ncbi:MAG TPA: SPFH domain-containing protein [Candidatus Limnocylindrales bacterium]|nr:SPFH domain-containing protein [Candidatus Limnocylindrales bacterium]